MRNSPKPKKKAKEKEPLYKALGEKFTKAKKKNSKKKSHYTEHLGEILASSRAAVASRPLVLMH